MQPSPDSTRRRWRPRLSVRALMILVLLAGGGVGWVVHQARQRRLAVGAIVARGGVAEYDYQYEARAGRRAPRGWWPPAWLRAALGPEYLHDVVWVGLESPTDEDLAFLARFPRVFRLYAGRGRVTDDWLRHLGHLTELRSLFLDRNPIRGDGLAHLRNLKRLAYLSLDETRVEDDRLAGLAHLTGLKRLDAALNPQLTGSFLRHVAGLPRLESLVLRRGGIDDRGLASLDRPPILRSLMLDDTRVTDAGLVRLRPMKTLRQLDLSRTAVTDGGLQLVRGWLPAASVLPAPPGGPR